MNNRTAQRGLSMLGFLFVAAVAVAAFIWVVRSGQLDDVDTPARRILFDDEPPRPR